MIRRFRTSLTIAAVPRPYDPGYPARLLPEEFARLIRARPVKTGIVAAAIALIAAQAGESPQEKEKKADDGRREEAVIGILRNHLKYPLWFVGTDVSRGRISSAYGQIERPVPLRLVPIMFGTPGAFFFDIATARKNANAIFEAYGLKTTESAAIHDAEVSATIHELTADKKHGFIVRTPTVPWRGDPASPVLPPDPPEVALSDAESKILADRGMDLLIADQEKCAAAYAPGGVPDAYWIAAVVEYLNGIDDGMDVHVESAIWGDAQEFRLPRPRVLRGDAVISENAHSVKAMTETTLVYDVGADESPTVTEIIRRNTLGEPIDDRATATSKPTPKPATNRGAISRFVLENAPHAGGLENQRLVADFFAPGRKDERVSVRVEQADPSGTPKSFAAGIEPTFLPSWFDAARPFTIYLMIPAGDREIPTHLLTSLPWSPPKADPQKPPR